MQQETLNDLVIFIAIARERSFTRAASQLGLSQSTLSSTIKALEARLGVRLLTRTTRSVSLTEAGERLYNSLAPRFEELEDSLASVGEYKEKPAGSFKVYASDFVIANVLWPKMVSFLRQFPEINVEFSSGTGERSSSDGKYDLCIDRKKAAPDGTAKFPVTYESRMMLTASPDYLSKRGMPSHPDELDQHSCVMSECLSGADEANWLFQQNAEILSVTVKPQLCVSTPTLALDATKKGAGFAYLPAELAAHLIDSGQIIEVLTDWALPLDPLYGYYPIGKEASRAFAQLVDALTL